MDERWMEINRELQALHEAEAREHPALRLESAWHIHVMACRRIAELEARVKELEGKDKDDTKGLREDA